MSNNNGGHDSHKQEAGQIIDEKSIHDKLFICVGRRGINRFALSGLLLAKSALACGRIRKRII